MQKDKILIVDDSPFNRKVLRNQLEDKYYIVEAADGFEAIEKINSNITSLSLILMDILMPRLDGLSVLKILKENSILNSIPVILITASENSEKEGLELGAVDFITKPFEPSIVESRVSTQISLKRYKDQLEELLALNMVSSDMQPEEETKSSNIVEKMENITKIYNILIGKDSTVLSHDDAIKLLVSVTDNESDFELFKQLIK